MLIKDLPTKRKEVVLYKIHLWKNLSWNEQPRAYKNLETASQSAAKFEKARIVKRTDNGWEVVE